MVETLKTLKSIEKKIKISHNSPQKKLVLTPIEAFSEVHSFILTIKQSWNHTDYAVVHPSAILICSEYFPLAETLFSDADFDGCPVFNCTCHQSTLNLCSVIDHGTVCKFLQFQIKQ